MEVIRDYAQTEVGFIPETWFIAELGDLITFIKGFPFKSSEYRNFGIRIIRVSDTTYDAIKEEDPIYVSERDSSKYANWRLRENDLIVSTVGSKPPMYDSMVGKVIIIDRTHKNSLLNQNAVLIRDRQHRDYFQVLLLNHLRTKKYLSHIESIYRGNANQASITLKELFQFRIPLPVAELEQREIAKAMSDVDALLDSLDRLIAKKRDLKQAAMQQLLTGQTRLPGFSGEWEVKQLGDVANFYKGKGLPKSELNKYGAQPCVHYGELFTLYGETINKVISYTDRSEVTFRSVSNDVLMPTSDVTPRGLAKASCIRTDGVILGGDILVIRSDTKLIFGTYLSYLIRYEEDQVLQLVTGSTVFHLYGADMKKFKFLMPQLEEQRAIVFVLDEMNSELSVLEKRRNKTVALKQGMMQELLTGRTRLV